MKRQGFTIVELLIVIVIIAILAAITLVAFNGVQQRATDASLSAKASQVKRKIELRNATEGAYICTSCTSGPSVTTAYSLTQMVPRDVGVYLNSDTYDDNFTYDKTKVTVVYQPEHDDHNQRWIAVIYWNSKQQEWTSVLYQDDQSLQTYQEAGEWPYTPGWTFVGPA